MRNVVLIGFMGTGKTTVGTLLAAKLGWEFCDTDRLIEQEAGMPIPDIFARRGEAEFRRLESDVLARTLGGGRKVVSTGGGAVLAEANRKAMLESGFVAALAADAAAILERVRGDGSRPLLAGDPEARVRRLLEERKHAYDFAHLRIDTTRISPEQAAEAIFEAYRRAAGEEAGGNG